MKKIISLFLLLTINSVYAQDSNKNVQNSKLEKAISEFILHYKIQISAGDNKKNGYPIFIQHLFLQDKSIVNKADVLNQLDSILIDTIKQNKFFKSISLVSNYEYDRIYHFIKPPKHSNVYFLSKISKKDATVLTNYILAKFKPMVKDKVVHKEVEKKESYSRIKYAHFKNGTPFIPVIKNKLSRMLPIKFKNSIQDNIEEVNIKCQIWIDEFGNFSKVDFKTKINYNGDEIERNYVLKKYEKFIEDYLKKLPQLIPATSNNKNIAMPFYLPLKIRYNNY